MHNCFSALGLHLAQRLEALWRRRGGGGGSALGAAQESEGGSHRGGGQKCDWLREGGALTLPEFPPLPEVGNADPQKWDEALEGWLLPIPRLLPKGWEQLESRRPVAVAVADRWRSVRGGAAAGGGAGLVAAAAVISWRLTRRRCAHSRRKAGRVELRQV